MGSTRQSGSFPTVAYIRKGTPKQIRSRDNREYNIMGKDLKSKFRIEFLSGTNFKRENDKPSIREVWHSLHEKDYVKYGSGFVTQDGYEVSYLRAMIPTARVMDGWEWSNKTYNGSGMLIASADGEKYITKKDPITMETLVKRGEPYTPFTYGDAISYNNGKKEVKLELKSSGKLKLFLPELGEMVFMELRTTSYLDSLNIEQNLLAIQGIADVINGGVAGGIPLDIYRVEQPVPYMGDDGKPHTANQWFVQIKANSEWANQAIARMNGYAMGAPQLTAPIIFAPPELPASALEEVDDDEGDTPEQIIRENVAEGVITETNENEFVAEETVTPESIHEKIMKLAGEKGGKKNTELTNLVKSYGHGGNFKKIQDVETLNKLCSEIKNLKEIK